ncbi:MAG: histidine phosphatase family protein [Ectothiorhodospiraceae bacterium]|nr:histidine phosphatase family protein [Ectothiorhodospiraceae bacterium]
MSLLFIVRHGQAAFGEADYDRLSELGRQQSRWLGQYFLDRGVRFSRAVAGELSRQQDTAREILETMGQTDLPLVTHGGLNEYDGESVYAAYTGNQDQHLHQQADYKDYWRTFRRAYETWIDGGLPDAVESWDQFNRRIQEALAAALEGAGREDTVLVTTSGGVMGSTMTQVLGTSGHAAIDLNFQIRNTAICEFIATRRGPRLISYNAIPHLETADRRHAITHV